MACFNDYFMYFKKQIQYYYNYINFQLYYFIINLAIHIAQIYSMIIELILFIILFYAKLIQLYELTKLF